jgi:hypothetical protein
MDNEPRSAHGRVQTVSQVKQSSVSDADLAEFRKARPCGRIQTSKSLEAEFRQRGCLAEFRQKFLLFFSSVECSHRLSFSQSIYLYFSNTICTHIMYNVTVDLCMHISKFMQNFVSYL